MKELPKFSYKKVAWISDRFYPEYQGGAEITEFVLMEIGRKQGLKIDYWDKKPTKEYDFYIIGNTHNWSLQKVLNIIQGKKFVFFSHDPLSKLQTIHLLKKAFLIVFMSPKHQEYYSKKVKIKNFILQPPAFLDLEKWKSGKKEEHALYVGDLNPYKGIRNLYQFAQDHPEITFKVYGRNFASFPFTLDNFHYYGWLPEEDLPKELGKAKYFVHLPSKVDPGPHMVINAFLSDCELIVNKNVGVLSYDWNWNDKDEIKKKLKEYQETFWKRIDKYYKELES